MAIIGISGKIGSGKDTVGKIIQALTCGSFDYFRGNVKAGTISVEDLIEEKGVDIVNLIAPHSDWKIKKFAYKLKQIVSLLIGIPIEDLEKQEVKDRVLGEEWIRYAYAHGFTKDHNGDTTMLTTDCSKERYEQEVKVNWQTAYKVEYTVRLLLQRIGTEAMRNQIHTNIWVNALFADYKLDNGIVVEPISEENKKKYPVGFAPNKQQYFREPAYPNWIITDMRFSNELQAVKDRGGVLIRLERFSDILRHRAGEEPIREKFDPLNEQHLALYLGDLQRQHPSETALDNAEFDYIIDNNGTIEELVEKVREILVKEKII
jgi:hypothetical protein